MNREQWQERMKDYREAKLPAATEVADDILTNVLTEYDITTWKTLTEAEQAQAFRDIIAIQAAYKRNKKLSVLENRNKLLFEVQMYCAKFLTQAAKAEGFN